MAVKFQYNKTSLNEIGKQLKVRQKALPTLQNKESALRLEVRKAKNESDRLIADLEAAMDRYSPPSGTSSIRGSWPSRTWTCTP